MDHCDCNALISSFHFISTSLLMYLDGLKFCRCDEQLQRECEEKLYSLSPFHSLLYDKMCDPERYEELCSGNNRNSEDIRMCGQLEQYKRGVLYDEWFVAWSPFCSIYGFGASQDVYQQNPAIFIPFENMPSSCQRASILAVTIFYLLSVMIIIANVTVLLVVRYDQYFHSPYGYFKASIALADLFVGLLVIPLIIYLFHKRTFTPLPFHHPGQFSTQDSNQSYYNIVGFFTIFALSISVYSLAASSMDRYLSISRPFRYKAKKFFTRKRSLLIIIGIWILSAMFGLFPSMSSYTDYAMVSATFVLAAQKPRSNRYTKPFDWTSLFNVTNSSANRDEEAVEQAVTQFLDTSSTNGFVTSASDVISSSKELNQSEASLYLILSLYLLSLIIPLGLVWTVNICTARAYNRDQKKKIKRPLTEQISFLAASDVSAPLSAPPMTSCRGSVLSVQMGVSDDNRGRGRDQAKKATGEGPESSSQQGNNSLAVPRVARSSSFNDTVRTRLRTFSTNSATLFRFPSVSRISLSRLSSRNKTTPRVSRRLQKVLVRMAMSFTISLLPAIITLVMLILLAPYTDVYNTKNYSVEIKLYQNSFSYISSVFLFGNSFVNCIIYTVLGKRFREVTRRIYSGKISSIKALRRLSLVFDSFKKKTVHPATPTIDVKSV